MTIDFGRLTREQTIAILKQAMAELTELDVAQAIKETFSADERAEIAAQLEG